MAANRAIALDNQFSFPPAMQGLMPAYLAQDLLVVHAVGQLASRSRSHFDAQRYMEVGKPVDPDLTTGWLGRHLASVPPVQPDAALRGIGIGSGLAKTLVGGPKTLPIADPANYSIGGSSSTRAARTALLAANYANTVDPLRASALDAVGTMDLLASLNINAYTPANGVTYPNTSFGRALRSMAALIKSDIGLEAASIDIGGWDTHATQDPNGGQMFNNMLGFSTALGAFWADVIATSYPVTTVALSEFGRNVRENGSGGTDHGRATAMFAMGKRIAGGRVLTNNWPGLAPEPDGRRARPARDDGLPRRARGNRAAAPRELEPRVRVPRLHAHDARRGALRRAMPWSRAAGERARGAAGRHARPSVHHDLAGHSRMHRAEIREGAAAVEGARDGGVLHDRARRAAHRSRRRSRCVRHRRAIP